MTDFVPGEYTDPTAYLNDLEQRIKAGLPVGVRIAVPAIPAAGAVNVTIVWPVAFTSAFYTVTATVYDPASATPYGALARCIVSLTPTQVVIRVSSSTALAASAATLHEIAIPG